ncbi:unnamed protein product [Clavelina lepadiformis]|uniref:Uncharacterized protein n=1 Tax=Clavelina lepadiformis TaxID=159417 RepID=A0ABP0GWM1_CLALP
MKSVESSLYHLLLCKLMISFSVNTVMKNLKVSEVLKFIKRSSIDRGYLGFSSETCSCKTIKSMWVEVCESPDDLTTEAIDYFMNIFATKPNGSELLTTFSIDGISRILHIFGPNADRCKSLEATRKMFDLFFRKIHAENTTELPSSNLTPDEISIVEVEQKQPSPDSRQLSCTHAILSSVEPVSNGYLDFIYPACFFAEANSFGRSNQSGSAE